jgi:hypothetical protein
VIKAPVRAPAHERTPSAGLEAWPRACRDRLLIVGRRHLERVVEVDRPDNLAAGSLGWLSAVPRSSKLRSKCRRPRFRISLQIPTTEFYEPYAVFPLPGLPCNPRDPLTPQGATLARAKLVVDEMFGASTGGAEAA